MNQEALLWELVKHNNSTLMKRNHVILSRDAANPSGIQRKSMCGMIQKDSVAIEVQKKDAKKPNSVAFSLSAVKARKFQAKDRKTALSHHVVKKAVKSVHKAAKIVKSINKYSNQQRAAASVKKVALLHKAATK